MPNCDYNCDNCAVAGNCDSRIPKAKLNEQSEIKHIIGVCSGKGGVGKSFVTSMLAVSLKRQGYKVGILDADVTGPSIPKSFGVKEKAYGEDSYIYPLITRSGIKIMSANCLLENEDEPIIWRGSLLSNLVKQFYEDVLWEDLDYLLIDMPPGTGDITLTVFQMIPIESLIIVTTPQDLVSLIVTKVMKMAELMNINVLGVIENMSYIQCPDCQKKINVFGESHLKEFQEKMHFNILGQLPIKQEISQAVDQGLIETVALEQIDSAVKFVTKGE